jgi:hypothetical protein
MDLRSAVAQAVLTPTTGDPPESLQGTLPIQAGVLKSITHQFISYKVCYHLRVLILTVGNKRFNTNLSILKTISLIPFLMSLIKRRGRKAQDPNDLVERAILNGLPRDCSQLDPHPVRRNLGESSKERYNRELELWKA